MFSQLGENPYQEIESAPDDSIKYGEIGRYDQSTSNIPKLRKSTEFRQQDQYLKQKQLKEKQERQKLLQKKKQEAQGSSSGNRQDQSTKHQTPEPNSANLSQNSTNVDSNKKDESGLNLSLNLLKKLEESIIAEKIETDSEEVVNDHQLHRKSSKLRAEDELLKKQSSNSYYEDISDEDEPDPSHNLSLLGKSSQYNLSQDPKKKNHKKRVNTTSNKPLRPNNTLSSGQTASLAGNPNGCILSTNQAGTASQKSQPFSLTTKLKQRQTAQNSSSGENSIDFNTRIQLGHVSASVGFSQIAIKRRDQEQVMGLAPTTKTVKEVFSLRSNTSQLAQPDKLSQFRNISYRSNVLSLTQNKNSAQSGKQSLNLNKDSEENLGTKPEPQIGQVKGKLQKISQRDALHIISLEVEEVVDLGSSDLKKSVLRQGQTIKIIFEASNPNSDKYLSLAPGATYQFGLKIFDQNDSQHELNAQGIFQIESVQPR